jgi:hypothetical protein
LYNVFNGGGGKSCGWGRAWLYKARIDTSLSVFYKGEVEEVIWNKIQLFLILFKKCFVYKCYDKWPFFNLFKWTKLGISLFIFYSSSFTCKQNFRIEENLRSLVMYRKKLGNRYCFVFWPMYNTVIYAKEVYF